MELKQIKHFLAVAQARNFGRAADALGVTQQALSYSIGQLERSLGSKLFQRGQFGAELTEEGTAFARRAKLVCSELELARAEVEALRSGAAGQVRIGMSHVVAHRLFPDAMKRFHAARPTVAVVGVVDHSRHLFEHLLEGEFDFVVSTPMEPLTNGGELAHERLGRQLSFDANLLAMRAGHPLSRRREVTLEALREYPWIMPVRFGGFSHRIAEHFLHYGIAPPEFVLHLESISLAIAVMRQTDFMAVLGREVMEHELEHRILHGVVIPGLEAKTFAYVTVRRRFPLSATAQALLEVIQHLAHERDRL